MQVLRDAFRSRDREQPFGKVDPNDSPLRSNIDRGWYRGSAAAAPNIKHRRSRCEREPFDGAPAVAIPERKRAIVEVIRGRVISRLCLQLGWVVDRIHRQILHVRRGPRTVIAAECKMIARRRHGPKRRRRSVHEAYMSRRVR
jgi:hypothetical protein